MNDISIKGVSFFGQHKINEDFLKYATLPDGKTIVVLADGMGGLSHGDFAAKTVVQAVLGVIENGIKQYDTADLLRMSLNEADVQIEMLCRKLKCRMGAAVTALVIADNAAYYTWLGNVRLYLSSEGKFETLTKDHVFSSSKCNGTFLTRCINGKGFRELPPVGISALNRPATLYLCTDGFYQSVAESDINGFDLDALHNPLNTEDDSSVIEIKLQ